MTRLTKHVREAILERGIALDWIERTLVSPDAVGPDRRDPRLTRSYRAIPERGGRILRFVDRAEDADILVITAHFDRGVKQ